MGLLCERGRGLAKDWAAAERWYLRAASAGSARGMAHVGNILRRRSIARLAEGGAEDSEELEGRAAGWWRRARKAGHTAEDFPPELSAPQAEGGIDRAILARFAEDDAAGVLEELLRARRREGSQDGSRMDDAGASQLAGLLRGLGAKAAARSTPSVRADSAAGPWGRRGAMTEAVRREGAASMRECASFLLASGRFRESVGHFALGRTGEGLRALHDALFEDERAVLFTGEGPGSKVRCWPRNARRDVTRVRGRRARARERAAGLARARRDARTLLRPGLRVEARARQVQSACYGRCRL